MPTIVKLVETLPPLRSSENRLGRKLSDLVPARAPDQTINVPAGKWELYGDTSVFYDKGERTPSSVWLNEPNARVHAFARGRGDRVEAQMTRALDDSWEENLVDGFPQDGVPMDVVQSNGSDSVNYKLKSQYEKARTVEHWLQYAQP